MEELRKQIEQKYNLNLNTSNKDGEKTYWDLREYFVKELESEGIVMVDTDYIRMSDDGYVVDVKGIREEFENKLKQIAPDFHPQEELEFENDDNSNQNPPPYEN